MSSPLSGSCSGQLPCVPSQGLWSRSWETRPTGLISGWGTLGTAPRTRPSPPFTQRAWLIPEGRCRCPPHPLPRLCRAQGHPRHHHRVVGWSLHHPDLNRSCPKSEIGPQSSIDHMASFVTCVSCPGCHLCHLQQVQSFGATLAPWAFLHVP